LKCIKLVAEGLVFLCAFLNALLIKGVRNGRQGVKLPRFGEASSTYGHDVLENKSRGIKSQRRTERRRTRRKRTGATKDESQGESEYLRTSSGHRAIKTNQLCGDRHAFANETGPYNEAQWVREGTGTRTGSKK
jgi:hypothetical protein